jgi:hypothetical protein
MTPCAEPPVYRISHPANAVYAAVLEIISRSGCDATVASPPQTVAGCTFPRETRSNTSIATMKRSEARAEEVGPGKAGKDEERNRNGHPDIEHADAPTSRDGRFDALVSSAAVPTLH